MQLPWFSTNTGNLANAMALLQTQWRSILNPFLANPLNEVSILEGIHLINGVTVINHKLNRMQQGWFLTDLNGAAQIYRSAALNDKTLTLTSNAAVIVNIGVF